MKTVKIEVRPDGKDGWIACPPNAPGTPIVGRGGTWLTAIGDYALQMMMIEARVLDEHGKPVPQDFFPDRYRKD